MTQPTAARLLDLARDDHAHIADRLDNELVGWLGTTRPGGRPHHVPVWFAWDDPHVTIFSLATSQKIRNLRANRACTLTLDSGDGGNDIVILEGHAEVLPEGARRGSEGSFAAKYAPHVEGGMDGWAGQFPIPIHVTISRAIAWSKPGGQLRYTVATG